MDFTCCYCEQKFGTFEETIGHSVSCHPCEQLKYRIVILNVESGKKQYVTKSFNVIPSKVHENGQIISVQREHRKRTEQKHDSLGEHQSTGLFANSIEESDTCRTYSMSASTSQEGPESLSWTDELFELTKLVPEVAKCSQDNGLLLTWLMFHQLIVNGKCPLDNIAFRLFLDVVRFFGSSTTSQMRYSKDTKLFWRINFLSHCEQGKRGPSSSLWCFFLWRTRFLFYTYDFPHSGQRCPRQALFSVE